MPLGAGLVPDGGDVGGNSGDAGHQGRGCQLVRSGSKAVPCEPGLAGAWATRFGTHANNPIAARLAVACRALGVLEALKLHRCIVMMVVDQKVALGVSHRGEERWGGGGGTWALGRCVSGLAKGTAGRAGGCSLVEAVLTRENLLTAMACRPRSFTAAC